MSTNTGKETVILNNFCGVLSGRSVLDYNHTHGLFYFSVCMMCVCVPMVHA